MKTMLTRTQASPEASLTCSSPCESQTTCQCPAPPHIAMIRPWSIGAAIQQTDFQPGLLNNIQTNLASHSFSDLLTGRLTFLSLSGSEASLPDLPAANRQDGSSGESSESSEEDEASTPEESTRARRSKKKKPESTRQPLREMTRVKVSAKPSLAGADPL